MGAIQLQVPTRLLPHDKKNRFFQEMIAFCSLGRRPNAWVTKIETFTRWKRWDNWQNVAVRNPALWEQSMLEFVQFAVGRQQFILTFVPAP